MFYNYVVRVFPLCSWFPLAETSTAIASVPLWEDKSLAGFMPLKALSLQSTMTDTDHAGQKVCSTVLWPCI